MEKSVKANQSGLLIKPMKKVLIALDYDTNSKKVAETGFALAKSMNAEVILLHVIADEIYYSSLESSPVMGFVNFSTVDFFEFVNSKDLTKAAQYYLDKVKHHLGDQTIQTVVASGDFAEIILKNAKHLQADLIVIGSHSRRWLEQILMGSVTEKVLHSSTIPLLIIPIKKFHSI